MKRIDIVYKKLKEIAPFEGIDAKTLAGILNLTRANVSNDLNILCKEGKVKKSKGRPVLFKPVERLSIDENLTELDLFIKENGSLIVAAEQAKAAILYPPKGMHALILGETGAGKSMFVGMMHKYAIEIKRMPEDAPFITFNCADYANNPQLLLSQLFGVKKGAYTGADSERKGLIEKADRGILFLDEVHRLPAEGQEMFFTFMDKGLFRRLGETDTERCANVLIISATTEDPDSSLLKTFTRRIPMIIKIPPLSERSTEERLNLITKFLKDESVRLNKEIKVSVNSIRAFLSYDCPNNIGQLKTDIQLSCAKAYTDFLTNKKDSIKINSPDLPTYVREGLYKEKEHRQIWSNLIEANSKYCVFNQSQNKLSFKYDKNEESIYDVINTKVNELKRMGINHDELQKIIDEDIKKYFTQYIYGVNSYIDKSSLGNVVETYIIDIVDKISEHVKVKLDRQLSQKVYIGMALHIQSSIERIKRNKKIINPQLNKIRIEFRDEFDTALECIKIIEKFTDLSMPIDEAGFLAMFFVLDDEKNESIRSNVGVLIIAHGDSTATSIAKVTNNLLSTNYAAGINAPLSKSPQEVLNDVRNYLKSNYRDSGYVFLVDMGSLTTFGDIIEKETGMPIKIISLVSTLHAIEATRKAILGCSLDEIYTNVAGISSFNEDEHTSTKFAIITACLTGEGSAIIIKNFLRNNLKFDYRIFEIISLNLIGRGDITARLKKISSEKEIICIISTFQINTDIPIFSIDDVLNLKGIDKIQNIIDLKNTYFKMGKTLKQHLKNVNGEEVFKDVELFISIIESKLDMKLNLDTLIGVAFHVSCMIDRLKSSKQQIEFTNRDLYMSQNPNLYNSIKSASEFLVKKYDIEISDDEICYIMNFFDKGRLKE